MMAPPLLFGDRRHAATIYRRRKDGRSALSFAVKAIFAASWWLLVSSTKIIDSQSY
jgi:hypothetical protein